MNDAAAIYRALGKVRLASPNLYDEAMEGMNAIIARIHWLTGTLHAGAARYAYTLECGNLGVVPDWSNLADDVKQMWADHVEADVKAELEKAGIPLG